MKARRRMKMRMRKVIQVGYNDRITRLRKVIQVGYNDRMTRLYLGRWNNMSMVLFSYDTFLVFCLFLAKAK